MQADASPQPSDKINDAHDDQSLEGSETWAGDQTYEASEARRDAVDVYCGKYDAKQDTNRRAWYKRPAAGDTEVEMVALRDKAMNPADDEWQ